MAVNFPASPTNNQVFTSGGISWIYSTAIGAWKILPNTIQGTTGLQGIQGIQGAGVQGQSGTSQGIQGLQGLQGTSVQGASGTSQGIQGIQGANGLQGIQGTSIQGTTGTQGASIASSINATAVTTDTKLYPVLVYGAGSTQTAQTITTFTFNYSLNTFTLGTNTSQVALFTLNGYSPFSARGIQIKTLETSRWFIGTDSESEIGSNTGSNLIISNSSDTGSLIGTVRPLTIYRANGTVALANLTTSGTATFSGGIAPSFVIRKENTTGEGGQFQLQKSDTSTLSGDLVVDLVGNLFRIYEAATPFKGVSIDISTQASQSTFLTSSNYNSYAPTLTGTGASGEWPIWSYYSRNYTQGFNGNWNTDFTDAPAGSMISRGDTSTGSSTGGPGGGTSWWFQQNFRHANGTNYWGVQIAWGWEDNAHRLLTRNWQAGSASSWIEYINTNNSRSHIGSFGTGEVGTYALLRFNTLTTAAEGSTHLGSGLRYSNVNGGATGGAPAGTWRLMGATVNTGNSQSTSVFLRIS